MSKINWLGGIAVVGWLVGGYFGRIDWRLDLLNHARPYLLIPIGLFCLLAVLLRQRWQLSLGLLLLFAVGFDLAPYYWPRAAPNAAEPDNTITVFSYNVQYGNRPYDRLLALLDSEQPDLVLLIEVDRPFLEALSSLNERYPHQLLAPAPHPFGIALLSKRPLINERIERHNGEIAWLSAEFELNEQQVLFRGVHTYPPMGPIPAKIRDSHLNTVLSQSENQPPTIVAGDLNATPWSYPLRPLLDQTSFYDTRLGFGLPATWQRGFVMLPIDYVLATEQFTVADHQILDRLGSDHAPISVTLSLP